MSGRREGIRKVFAEGGVIMRRPEPPAVDSAAWTGRRVRLVCLAGLRTGRFWGVHLGVFREPRDLKPGRVPPGVAFYIGHAPGRGRLGVALRWGSRERVWLWYPDGRRSFRLSPEGRAI